MILSYYYVAFKYVVRNDEKYTDALRMLYEEFITPCISPETNVFINEEKNGAILWYILETIV